MDFKEIKKIAAYARKVGIKSLEFDGFKLELHDKAPVFKEAKPRLIPTTEKEATVPKPSPEPTLDHINEFIYGTSAEPN